jgi:hypothetical protein
MSDFRSFISTGYQVKKFPLLFTGRCPGAISPSKKPYPNFNGIDFDSAIHNNLNNINIESNLTFNHNSYIDINMMTMKNNKNIILIIILFIMMMLVRLIIL